MVLFKDDCIYASSKNKDVVELNLNLDIVKSFKGRDSQPLTIDANENYLVVGYGSGFVDVHSKNDSDQNGMYRKVLVSKLRCIQLRL